MVSLVAGKGFLQAKVFSSQHAVVKMKTNIFTALQCRMVFVLCTLELHT